MDALATKDRREIDPDPWTVISIAVTVVSIATSFVQMYKGRKSNPPAPGPHLDQRDQALAGLEGELQSISSSLKQITRLIDQGSQDPDGQFYDAPLRVGKTELKLETQQVLQLGTTTGSALGRTGNMFMWTTNLVTLQPLASYRIGEKIDDVTTQAVDQINDALASGKPMRIALQEARSVILALEQAIDLELNTRGN